MEDVAGGIFAAVILCYFAASAVFLPVTIIEDWMAERDCAREHQVYSCKRGEWKPMEAPK